MTEAGAADVAGAAAKAVAAAGAVTETTAVAPITAEAAAQTAEKLRSHVENLVTSSKAMIILV